MSRSDPRPVVAAPVAAQVLGQDGARRGLRAGMPALNAARRAYMSTQWSGADDRRPDPGLLVRARA